MPTSSSNGTTVPDAAMPKPTPRKIAPLAMPGGCAGTCGSTVIATSTMMMPPEMPDIRRQPKNQLTDNGNAQPKKAADVSSIMPRNVMRAP
jgi:hypothetical protein